MGLQQRPVHILQLRIQVQTNGSNPIDFGVQRPRWPQHRRHTSDTLQCLTQIQHCIETAWHQHHATVSAGHALNSIRQRKKIGHPLVNLRPSLRDVRLQLSPERAILERWNIDATGIGVRPILSSGQLYLFLGGECDAQDGNQVVFRNRSCRHLLVDVFDSFPSMPGRHSSGTGPCHSQSLIHVKAVSSCSVGFRRTHCTRDLGRVFLVPAKPERLLHDNRLALSGMLAEYCHRGRHDHFNLRQVQS
mmetsp:Transcript_43563/g.115017  ORF Transcript_43563/g.115017 Transcript_43563/m.115017 type:complete len:247 (+) Transcript_43563:909-1649(+)